MWAALLTRGGHLKCPSPVPFRPGKLAASAGERAPATPGAGVNNRSPAAARRRMRLAIVRVQAEGDGDGIAPAEARPGAALARAACALRGARGARAVPRASWDNSIQERRTVLSNFPRT